MRAIEDNTQIIGNVGAALSIWTLLSRNATPS
jgi:hypothetical protein